MSMFQLTKRFPNLIAVYSSRKDGNMSLRWGKPKPTQENRANFLAQHEIKAEQCIVYSLYHKDRVVYVDAEDRGRGMTNHRSMPRCDGAYTDTRNIFHFFNVADCLPIIFYDPKKQVIGLVHASWQSTEMKIVSKLIKALEKKFKCKPKDIWVEIGPSIHPCCYQFKNPTQKLLAGWEKYCTDEPGGLTSIDLLRYNHDQLLEAGIAKKHLIESKICTSCHSDELFSHYRDVRFGRPEGRFAILVGMK